MMKNIFVALTLLLATISFNANAWFFFMFPIPRLGGGSSGATTSAQGNLCHRDSAKVGEVITSPLTGNTQTIRAVHGPSTRCTTSGTQLAEVDFAFSFISTVAVNLPDEYESKPIPDLERFNGSILNAISKSTKNKGIRISSRKRESNSDMEGIANNIEKYLANFLLDAKSSNAEKLVINGADALRFEVAGKLKGVFGQEVTYLYTIAEGDKEIVVLTSYAPTSTYELEKLELRKIAAGINGIKSSAPISTPQPVASPEIEQNNAVTNPEAVLTTGGKNEAAPQIVNDKLSLDTSKQKCAELGFKPGTEAHGKCVLQLSK